ncbi:MAG: glycosyltransferase family 2 protein [Bacteroidales bacterium]|nr:glycosyltransferase family 2 protein [Bacteroidales bacterium]
MTISIVIPVYNVAFYVEQCVLSVSKQLKDVDAEVILVDDCGVDSSLALAHASFGKFSNVRVVKHDRNRGLSAARNTGLSEAKGEYVLFVDSDDILADDCLLKLAALAKEHPDADVVAGQFDEFAEGIDYHPSSWRQHGGIYVQDIITPYMQHDIPVTAWNKLCRVSFLKDNRLTFEEGLVHEDALWSFQVACCANKVVVADAVTYHYRQRRGSLDKQKNASLHLEHYAKVNVLQAKFVFERNLEKDKQIFQMIDQRRFQLLADACKEDITLAQHLYAQFRSYPYWNFWQRSGCVFLSLKVWMRGLHWSLPENLGFMFFNRMCS